MNGNTNKTQRLGDTFLKEIEEIIKEIEDKQDITLSIAKITNFITSHSEFQTIKQDTIDFDYKTYFRKWKL